MRDRSQDSLKLLGFGLLLALLMGEAAPAAVIHYTTGPFEEGLTWYPGIAPPDGLGVRLTGVEGSADLAYGIPSIVHVNDLWIGSTQGTACPTFQADRTGTIGPSLAFSLSQRWWASFHTDDVYYAATGDPHVGHWEIGLLSGEPAVFDLGALGLLQVTPLGLGPFTAACTVPSGWFPDAETDVLSYPPALNASAPVYAEFLLLPPGVGAIAAPEPSAGACLLLGAAWAWARRRGGRGSLTQSGD